MKNSLELKETRSGLVETLESIKNTAEGESRNLNEAESIEVDNALKFVETLMDSWYTRLYALFSILSLFYTPDTYVCFVFIIVVILIQPRIYHHDE